MEIIGKIGIINNPKVRFQKRILTVGLVAILIAIISNIYLGNMSILVMGIPSLYILNLRSKMGNKFYYKEVLINVENNEQYKLIEIYNCEYYNKKMCSVRYIILKYSQLDFRYIIDKNLFQIYGIFKKELFENDEIVFSSLEEKENLIELYISNEDVQNIIKILQLEKI